MTPRKSVLLLVVLLCIPVITMLVLAEDSSDSNPSSTYSSIVSESISNSNSNANTSTERDPVLGYRSYIRIVSDFLIVVFTQMIFFSFAWVFFVRFVLVVSCLSIECICLFLLFVLVCLCLFVFVVCYCVCVLCVDDAMCLFIVHNNIFALRTHTHTHTHTENYSPTTKSHTQQCSSSSHSHSLYLATC